MQLAKISPALTQGVVRPIKTNLLRKLRVPILAATMAIGGSLVAKAQTNMLEKDTFEPTVTVVNDTIKNAPVAADTLLNINKKINDNTSLGVQVVNDNPLSMETSESAAEELYTKILANIANYGDTPYSAMYLALCDQKSKTEANGLGTADIDNQIDEIVESMKVYARDHQDEIKKMMKENGSITEFHYGKDNTKTGTLFQTLNISGVNQNDGTDNNTAQNDTVANNNKDFIGNVAYRMKAVTDKAEVETNINAGSDNIDIQLAAAYRTKTEDGGNLLLSLNGRETMIGNTTNGSIGVSADYSKNKFSTGIYYYHDNDVDESGDKYKYSEIEGYLKYKQNANLKAGLQFDDYSKYYYSNLKLSGIKDFENSNLKLSGSLSAEVGSYIIDFSELGVDKNQFTNLDFGANGGIYFKTDGINTGLNGRVSYRYMLDSYDGSNTSGLNMSLLGVFSTNKISVSAMISAFREFFSTPENVDYGDPDNSVSVGVGFEIKDLLKGIPLFSYTSTSVNNQVQHFFNVTLKTSLEALRKNQ